MYEHGAIKWTSCAPLIPGRNGKQCRERWVNILDPCVKIGGWSDSDQQKIFELMKEYFTSWSKISKGLRGRTENSIKNYFYSTIRRIQSLDILSYFIQMHEGRVQSATLSIEDLEQEYQLNKLNHLGRAICKWLYFKEDAIKEHLALFEYLLRVITDDKKRPVKKESKSARRSDSTSCGYSSEEKESKVPSGNNSQTSTEGVHPLLSIILNGGWDRLTDSDGPSERSIEPLSDEDSVPQRSEVKDYKRMDSMQKEGMKSSSAISQIINILSLSFTKGSQASNHGVSSERVGLRAPLTSNEAQTENCRSEYDPIFNEIRCKHYEKMHRSTNFLFDDSLLTACTDDQGIFDQQCSKQEIVFHDWSRLQVRGDSCINDISTGSLLICCKCMTATRECSCLV